MRVVLQRVSEASVTVEGKVLGHIGKGLLILLGLAPEDGTEDGQWLAEKLTKLRLFEDAEGAMNRSLLEEGAEALVVSQFTLFASTRKGTRPSFHAAAPPEQARALYEGFLLQLQQALGGRPVATGRFGAKMAVHLVNDGPVTLILDTKHRE